MVWVFAKSFCRWELIIRLDVKHIMRLGGWESLDMVLRYTRSVRFEERLRLCQRED